MDLPVGSDLEIQSHPAFVVMVGRVLILSLDLVIIPDQGATERWREKSALLSDICKRVVVSDMLERLATDEQRSQGLDIADFFLTVPTQRQILQQMIRRNPALQLLIDELDLELIE